LFHSWALDQRRIFSFGMRDAEALPTAAATGLVVRLGIVGRRQEFFPTVLAAKVEGFSIAFGVEGGGGIHGHSADGVFGFGFRRIHDAVSFVFAVIAFPTSVFGCR
jgi:hypothetical protein